MRRRLGWSEAYHRVVLIVLLASAVCVCASCGKKPETGQDEKVSSLGSIEVTARLVEIKGDLIDDPLYDYAHVMKYEVLEVHRGDVNEPVIYVGHYNPAKPRDSVADARVGDIGGNVKKFKAGDIHRMALEVPIDDYYMGGIINKYFDSSTGPVYWAVWTNRVVR